MLTIDHIYCINLDKRQDRWLQMQKYFDHFNINVTRFSAKTGEDADTDGVIMYPKNDFFKQGEKGCSYSHYLIWQECLAKNYKRVLILEDDCIFASDWINILIMIGTPYF